MNKLLPLFAAAFLISLSASANSEFKPSLKDPYSQREFEWSAFIHAQQVAEYLNYPTSKLKPITKVSITFRPEQKKQTQLYEDLWYSHGKVLGAHHARLLPEGHQQMGAIILGGDISAHVAEVTNALMHVVLDLQLRHFNTTVVLIPQDHYDDIASELRNYGFFNSDSAPTNGQQFSLVLRSVPYAYEDRVFMRN